MNTFEKYKYSTCPVLNNRQITKWQLNIAALGLNVSLCHQLPFQVLLLLAREHKENTNWLMWTSMSLGNSDILWYKAFTVFPLIINFNLYNTPGWSSHCQTVNWNITFFFFWKAVSEWISDIRDELTFKDGVYVAEKFCSH